MQLQQLKIGDTVKFKFWIHISTDATKKLADVANYYLTSSTNAHVGTASGTTKLTVTEEKINAGTVYKVASASTTYGTEVEGTVVDVTEDISGLTDGSTYYLVECDAAGHALAQGSFVADVNTP